MDPLQDYRVLIYRVISLALVDRLLIENDSHFFPHAIFLTICVCVYVCSTLIFGLCSAHGGQKMEVVKSLELELQVVVSFWMWVLRTKPWSSERAVLALNS